MIIAGSLGALMERMELSSLGPRFTSRLNDRFGRRYWALMWSLDSFLGSAQFRSPNQRVLSWR